MAFTLMPVSVQDEVVEDKAGAALPATVISGLASSNWKERLSSMETFLQVNMSTVYS